MSKIGSMENQESQGHESSYEYMIAEGPAGLTNVLNHLLLKAEQDESFAIADHYVLYQLNAQQSLIKVDLSQRPFQFWYYDLLGRPATEAVKEAIAKFLWERCGESKIYLQDSQ